MIGSPFWRIRNYGLLATFNYFRFGKLGFQRQFSGLQTLSFQDFITYLDNRIGIAYSEEIELTKSNVKLILSNLRLDYSKAVETQQIKNVLDATSSISRLILLEFLTRKKFFDTYIETGTQHGLTATLVGKTASRFNSSSQMYSIDVTDNAIISVEKNVNYVKLAAPARKNFKLITKQIMENQTKLLYFHDSDHSYENMLFEFNWAWNCLNAEFLVSDDIDGNSAFEDFCETMDISGVRVLIDDGPALGVAIRR